MNQTGVRENPLMIVYKSYNLPTGAEWKGNYLLMKSTEEDYEGHCNIKEGQYKII